MAEDETIMHLTLAVKALVEEFKALRALAERFLPDER
jgi:hypothetical protein